MKFPNFEEMLERMLDRVPDDLGKRESDIIYSALAPAAAELRTMYDELEIIMEETFADTASRPYLMKRAKERGMEPFPSTKAILKAEFTPKDLSVPIGSRYSLEDLNYIVTKKISDGVYQVECETAGSVGNNHFGRLIPIEYIRGLETAKIVELLIPGEDEEDTEVFRERFLASFNAKAYGGNIQDYVEKTNAIAGVGSTKVTPVWNGGGTVKLTILDSEYNKPTPTLISTVQEFIDPTKDSSGLGVAPIGHIVTVVAPNETKINIKTAITFESGYSYAEMKDELEKEIKDYLHELRKQWAKSKNTVVRISQIENRILSMVGVIDVENTTINDKSSNLVIGEFGIPVLGAITNG